MLSLIDKILFCYSTLREGAHNKIFPVKTCFQLRLDSHEKKLLQEISYQRGLRPQVMEIEYFLNSSKPFTDLIVRVQSIGRAPSVSTELRSRATRDRTNFCREIRS